MNIYDECSCCEGRGVPMIHDPQWDDPDFQREAGYPCPECNGTGRVEASRTEWFDEWLARWLSDSSDHGYEVALAEIERFERGYTQSQRAA